MSEDYTLAASIGFLRRDGRRANTDDKYPADDSRRRYVLATAEALLERAARERAEQEGAREEVFDLDAYLRQFPKPLYPR